MTILTKSNMPPVSTVAPRVPVQRVAAAYAAQSPATDIAARAAVAAAAPERSSASVQGQVAATQLEQVQRALDKLKQSIKPSLATSLKFEIDQSSGKTLVKIMDVETSAVVRQIPSEELLVIARALDMMEGRGGLVSRQA